MVVQGEEEVEEEGEALMMVHQAKFVKLENLCTGVKGS